MACRSRIPTYLDVVTYLGWVMVPDGIHLSGSNQHLDACSPPRPKPGYIISQKLESARPGPFAPKKTTTRSGRRRVAFSDREHWSKREGRIYVPVHLECKTDIACRPRSSRKLRHGDESVQGGA